MKKLALLSLIMLLALIVQASEDKFTQALKNCTPFSDNGSMKTSGMNVISHKQIVGWNGDRCIYKENVNLSGIKASTVCKFTKSQINELTSVLEAYELVQKYSGEKPDFSNLDEAQKNPVAQAWQKYLNDSSVCTISMDN